MEHSPFRWLLPIAVFAGLILAWGLIVRLNNLPPYILPHPVQVLETLVNDRTVLLQSLLVTLRTTVLALGIAVVGGVGLALIFASARIVEFSLFPIAVILQVTPIVAVAPLMLIYLDTGTAVLVCAFIVAFFPILANTTLGLNSVDPNLRDLFALSGATRWQTLTQLKLPTALPYFLGGLRIAGGLALIGAVVGEIGGLGRTGLGARLPYRRIRLPAEHSAHVCRAAEIGRAHV